MAGVISRETGGIISAPVFSAETRSRMLDAIICAYLDMHPEAIQEALAAIDGKGGAAE